MFQDIIDDFKAGRTCGVKVLVLPKGAEDQEAALVEDVIRRSFDARAVVVARDEARVSARHSVRNALVNGYSVLKGGSGRVAAFLGRAQEAAGEAAAELPGGGLAGLLVKLGIRALTDSPVTPLRTPPPYGPDALSRAVQDICRDHQAVLYVRKAYLDAADSLLFLYQTCGGRLDVMLGAQKRNLLVVFCVREHDLKRDLGRQIEEIVGESEHLEVVRLAADPADPAAPSPAASLVGKVRAAGPDARALLKRVYAYAAAAEANVVPDAVVRRAYPTQAAASLTWLERAGILERVGGGDVPAYWGIADAYDLKDLRKAVRGVWEEEAEATAGKDDDDDNERGVESPGDYVAADDVFEAVLAVQGETAANYGLLFRLARAGTRAMAGVRLAGRVVEQSAARGDVAGLGATLDAVKTHFEEHVFSRGDDLEATDEEWEGLADCARRLKSALDHLRAVPWGPAHGTVGAILGRLVREQWDAIPDPLDGEAKAAAEEAAGYLLVLTRRGRVKLVSLAAWGMEPRSRTSAAGVTECVPDPGRDGRVSETHAVRRLQMAWLFGTNGEAIAFPLTAVDATSEGQADGPTENLSVYLDPGAKWDRFADFVAAVCPFDEPSAVGALREPYEGEASYVEAGGTAAGGRARAKFGRDLATGGRLRTASGRDWSLRAVFADDAGDTTFAFRDAATGETATLGDRDVADLIEEGDLWIADSAAPALPGSEAGPSQPAAGGSWVLLVNEQGRAEAIPQGMLPRRPGGRVSLGGPLLTKVRPARWAVPVRAGDDLVVATTGNYVLRLKADAVTAGDRRVTDRLVALDEGETVAAVTVLPAGAGASAMVFIATDGGYGRMVAADEFPYGAAGGRGVVGQKVGKRSGSICTVEPAAEGVHFVLATAAGGVARIARSEMPVGRRTGVGLKLFPLVDGDRVVCGCTY